jgi:ATP phosphoribosyltransferase regulatory subunit
LARDLRQKDVYIGWQHGKMPEAIKEANKLRTEGLCVELGMTPQSKEQAEQCQKDKGYMRLVYIEG